MHVTARVGAVHLGWDVVSVAAGGGGTPIRPVQVEGTYTPPAYLLADASGHLHTSGAARSQRQADLGIAISDVRDVLGHRQIRIAGAMWPVELVFRARLYNPLAAIGTHLRGKPEVVALTFPDDWPDEKVDEYSRLVELLDVTTEPLPESVALSGYVRALGLVRAPQPGRYATGATGVYSDGRMCLVVAVHGDDEEPTESVGVPIATDATRDARSADNVVIEVMAAARSIGADTSTVLLTGNGCFNDALRLAFQNHLGHRLRVADHPMHALPLGAAHLLVTESEYGDEEPPQPPPPRQPPPPPRPEPDPRHGPRGVAGGPPPNPGPGSDRPPGGPGGSGRPMSGPPGYGAHPDAGGARPGGESGTAPGYPGPGAGRQGSSAPARPHDERYREGDGRRTPPGAMTRPPAGAPPRLTAPPEYRPTEQRPPEQPASERAAPRHGRHAAREPDDEPEDDSTTWITRDQGDELAPGGRELGDRSTRAPDDQRTTVLGRRADRDDSGTSAGRGAHAADDVRDDGSSGGKVWDRMKDNLFGAPTIVGAVALAAVVLSPDGRAEAAVTPPVSDVVATTPGAVAPVAVGPAGPALADRSADPHRGPDSLRLTVPAPRGALDPGPLVRVVGGMR